MFSVIIWGRSGSWFIRTWWLVEVIDCSLVHAGSFSFNCKIISIRRGLLCLYNCSYVARASAGLMSIGIKERARLNRWVRVLEESRNVSREQFGLGGTRFCDTALIYTAILRIFENFSCENFQKSSNCLVGKTSGKILGLLPLIPHNSYHAQRQSVGVLPLKMAGFRCTINRKAQNSHG